MPSPAPGVKSPRSGTCTTYVDSADLESTQVSLAEQPSISHTFDLSTGAASQRATPVRTPKFALPGTGGAMDSLGRGIPSTVCCSLSQRRGTSSRRAGPTSQAAQKLRSLPKAGMRVRSTQQVESSLLDPVKVGGGVDGVVSLLVLDSCSAEEILDTSLVPALGLMGTVAECPSERVSRFIRLGGRRHLHNDARGTT